MPLAATSALGGFLDSLFLLKGWIFGDICRAQRQTSYDYKSKDHTVSLCIPFTINTNSFESNFFIFSTHLIRTFTHASRSITHHAYRKCSMCIPISSLLSVLTFPSGPSLPHQKTNPAHYSAQYAKVCAVRVAMSQHGQTLQKQAKNLEHQALEAQPI